MKQIEVEYDGHKYSRNALSFGELTAFGVRVVQKLFGFGAVTGVVFANKFEQGDNLDSFYKVVKDVFDKDDWIWMVNLFLHDKANVLYIDGNPVDENELSEHFAGNFLAVYTITVMMAYNSLGEWKGLKEKLNGSLGNIAESLKALLEQQTEMIGEGLRKKMKDKSRK